MIQCSKFKGLAILTLVVVFIAASAAIAGMTKKDGSFYLIKIETKGSGADTVAVFTATGKPGYHPNKEYPWKLAFDEKDGVKLTKRVLKKADAATFDEKKVIFKVPVKISNGAKATGLLKFSFCNEKQCEFEKYKFVLP